MALRARRLANEPLCRLCRDRGVTRSAITPDHIKPLALGGTDTDDNIRCLCHEHHLEVTADQFNLKKKPKIGIDGWPEWGGSTRCTTTIAEPLLAAYAETVFVAGYTERPQVMRINPYQQLPLTAVPPAPDPEARR